MIPKGKSQAGLVGGDYGSGVAMNEIMSKLITQVDATMDEIINSHNILSEHNSFSALNGSQEELNANNEKVVHGKATSSFH